MNSSGGKLEGSGSASRFNAKGRAFGIENRGHLGELVDIELLAKHIKQPSLDFLTKVCQPSVSLHIFLGISDPNDAVVIQVCFFFFFLLFGRTLGLRLSLTAVSGDGGHVRTQWGNTPPPCSPSISSVQFGK